MTGIDRQENDRVRTDRLIRTLRILYRVNGESEDEIRDGHAGNECRLRNITIAAILVPLLAENRIALAVDDEQVRILQLVRPAPQDVDVSGSRPSLVDCHAGFSRLQLPVVETVSVFAAD